MTTRQAFIRGAEALWNEQCHAYGVGMARIERVGSASRCARQTRFGLRAAAIEVLAADRKARQTQAFHRQMFPRAYVPEAIEHRDHAHSDTLVTENQRDRWELESAADAFLAEHDEPCHGLDVTVRGHLQVKPDRVAFRGKVRYRGPSPVRYHAHATYEGAFIVDAEGVVTVPACTYRTDAVGRGYGWQGHRRIVVERVERKARKARRAAASDAVKVERAARGATGGRGRVVSWWSMSARSLPRRWALATTEQVDTASMVEAIVLTSMTDTPIELAPGHAVIFDGATVRRDDPASRSMSVREYARRAALSGLTLD